MPVLASILQSVGAWNAFNMDGGGSTAMWVKKKNTAYCQSYPAVGGCLVNRPMATSSGGERAIRTALVVLPSADTGTPAGLG
jgi:exopolysaccharide biosynthesis protein